MLMSWLYLIFWLPKELFTNSACRETTTNSTAERKHQHLLNIARSLFFQSRAPISFWGDCVQFATFLINRTSTPVLNSQSLYSILYGKEPDYHCLRAFGFFCFHQHCCLLGTSSHHEPHLLSLLGTLSIIRATDFMTSKPRSSLFPEMCSLLKIFFPFTVFPPWIN